MCMWCYASLHQSKQLWWAKNWGKLKLCFASLFMLHFNSHTSKWFVWLLKLQKIDLSKKCLTPQRILALQEQLLGFINEHVIKESGKYHVFKWHPDSEAVFPSLTPPSSSTAKLHSRKKSGSSSSVKNHIWVSNYCQTIYKTCVVYWIICDIIFWCCMLDYLWYYIWTCMLTIYNCVLCNYIWTCMLEFIIV